MLMPQKKKIATIIVDRLAADKKPDFVQKLGEESESKEEFETPEDESMIGLESAMDDFKSALSGGDAKAMASALRNFIYLCESEHEEPEEYK